MNILCENPCQTCVPFVGGASSPADPDYPFINLSSESPDVDRFFGRRYTPPGWRPPLGDNWYAIGCLGFCVSDVSQEEADLCALQQATICLSVNWPNVVPNPNGPFPPFVEEPRELFGNNPQFCQFLCPDGQPFTFTTAAGIFVAFSQAAADIMAYTYACNKAVENRICMGTLSPAYACVGTEYVGSLEASSGNLPVTFGLVGDLPPGYVMSQNMSTLFINGSTEDAGDYAFTITATDTLGNVMQKPTTLTVFGITTPSALTNAEVGEVYVQALVYGGTPSGTVSWAIVAGALPPGLSLSPTTGIISGTPESEGLFPFKVRITHGSLSCDKTFTIDSVTTSPCAIFDTVVWGAPVLVGTSSWSDGPGSTFAASGSGVQFNPGSADNSGIFNYEGPEIECCFTGLLTADDPLTAGALVQVAQDGNPILTLTAPFSGNQSFTIAESLVPSTISITVFAGGGSDDGPGAGTAEGTFGGC